MNYPVDNVVDAFDACHPDTPLSSYDDSRYVDLTSVRGGENLVQVVTNAIQRTRTPNFHQQLVTGHRGCGKSTELLRLKENLEEVHYFVVYVDIGEILDLGDVEYLDVLLAIAQTIAVDLEAVGLDLDQSFMKGLTDWFSVVTFVEEQKYESEGKVSVEASIAASIPLSVQTAGEGHRPY